MPFMRVLPTKWRRKPAGIDMERNYGTVTLCIVTVRRPSVSPFVHPFRSTAVTVAGGFAAERPAGKIYIDRQLRAPCCTRRRSPANAGSVTLRSDGGDLTGVGPTSTPSGKYDCVIRARRRVVLYSHITLTNLFLLCDASYLPGGACNTAHAAVVRLIRVTR